MKIGVISDTHDRLPTFARAIAMFRNFKVDAIFHAGDYIASFAAQLISPAQISIPVHCIYGDNDPQNQQLKDILPQISPNTLLTQINDKKIIMGHRLENISQDHIDNADIIISGHTHQPKHQIKNEKLFLNPGECCGWINDVPTAALIDLETLKADIIQIHP